MDASTFIAHRLKFRGKLPVICISVSFLVMIVSVSISSGFRNEIRDGVSMITGDIRLMPANQNILDEQSPMERNPSYLDKLHSVDGVESVEPVIYRAGIVRMDEKIQGVMFKGTESYSPSDTSAPLCIAVPEKLAEVMDLSEGGTMTTYFVGEKTKVRKFHVDSIYKSLLEDDDKLVVQCSLGDLQRVNDWDDNSVSALEIRLSRRFKGQSAMQGKASEIGSLVNLFSTDYDTPVYSSSAVSQYPQLFDWLTLIDFNVFVILVLMTIVAGFNMISGLLILLFENISTIGVLKSLGMTDRAIEKTFLTMSSSLVLKGMAAGNVVALVLCLIQNATHVIRLNPENYFLSFVPVHVDVATILVADVLAYFVIMLLLLIPCRFIAKVDPAHTVRVE